MIKKLTVCEDAPCSAEAKQVCLDCGKGICNSHSLSHEKFTCPALAEMKHEDAKAEQEPVDMPKTGESEVKSE